MSLSSSESRNPRLQRALSCLDVQLEAELIRYRKKRAGQSVSPVILPPKSKKAAKPAASTLDLPAFGNPPPAGTPPKMLSSDIPVSHDSSELVPISSEPTEEPMQPAFVLNNDLTESDTPPSDYLESSEELLRSLAQEEAKVQVERGFLEQLATPLGVGSMVVLLLSSAMFGYVIMNPSSLGGLGNLFARQEETPQAPAPATDAPYPPINAEEFVDLGLNNLVTLPTRPNPIPVPSISPAASPTPSPSASPSSDAAVVVPPANVPASAPAAPANNYTPSVVTPNYSTGDNYRAGSSGSRESTYSPPPITNYKPPVQSAPVQVAPTAVNRTAGGGYSYKIDIPYTGDRALSEIQKVVPDAYLRSDGKVQMGAVGSEAEAKARAQQLRQQGIEAEVNRR